MATRGGAADTKNVLDMMTAGIMGRKADAAAKLTPVKGEVQATHKAVPGLPNDVGVFMSNETLHLHAQELRKFAADAIAIADGIDAMLAGTYLGSSTDGKPVNLDDERKKREREADEKAAAREVEAAAEERAAIQTEDEDQAAFDARLEKLRLDAEAATYTPAGYAAIKAAAEKAADPEASPKDVLLAAVEAGEAAEKAEASGDGWSCPDHGKFTVETTRAGREYRVCPDCSKFERL